MSIFRTLESIMDDGGGGERESGLVLFLMEERKVWGLKEKRVAHGTE
jgi:hypothetical protein